MASGGVPCPGCGHGVFETDNFCPTCGTGLEWEDEEEQAWEPVAEPAQKSSSWGAWVVGILAVIGGFWAFNFVTSLGDDSGSPAGVLPAIGTDESYRVYVDQLPSYLTAEQAQNNEAAVNNAIQSWNTAGVQVSRTYSEQNANMIIQFIKEWGGDTLGQQYGRTGGLLQIGMGNSDCMDEWVPFASQSVLWITAHELGHAFGYDHSTDPNSLMYPTFNPVYADYCKMWDSSTSWAAGSTKGLQFTIANDASIKYSVQDRDSGSLDVCIMTQANWNAYSSNGMRGYACHDNVVRATDSANLAAGSYVLAMRCENYFDNCVVDYSLWRWP